MIILEVDFFFGKKHKQQGYVSLLQVEVKEIEKKYIKASVRYCWNMFIEHTFMVVVIML